MWEIICGQSLADFYFAFTIQIKCNKLCDIGLMMCCFIIYFLRDDKWTFLIIIWNLNNTPSLHFCRHEIVISSEKSINQGSGSWMKSIKVLLMIAFPYGFSLSVVCMGYIYLGIQTTCAKIGVISMGIFNTASVKWADTPKKKEH